MFAAYGYARGTTNRIAQWADISIGSLYQYYPNKDAILLDLAIAHLDAGMRGDPHLDEGIDTAPLATFVRAMVRAAVDNHQGDQQFLRVMLDETPRSATLWSKVAEIQKQRVARLRDVLATNPDVTVTDVDCAARLVIATLETVVHYLAAATDPVDLARLETELVEMILRYLSSTRSTI